MVSPSMARVWPRSGVRTQRCAYPGARRRIVWFVIMLAVALAGCVAVADLNGLKLINDRAGHLSGDAAIRQVATAIRSSIGPRRQSLTEKRPELRRHAFPVFLPTVGYDSICRKP